MSYDDARLRDVVLLFKAVEEAQSAVAHRSLMAITAHFRGSINQTLWTIASELDNANFWTDQRLQPADAPLHLLAQAKLAQVRSCGSAYRSGDPSQRRYFDAVRPPRSVRLAPCLRMVAATPNARKGYGCGLEVFELRSE